MWYYFLLNMQIDTADTESSCMESYLAYDTLRVDTVDKASDDTDYRQGIEVKGKGSPTTAGYYMYLVPLYADLAIEFTRVWEECMLDDTVLAFGKAVTSFSGGLDFAMTLFWRYFSEEDRVLY